MKSPLKTGSPQSSKFKIGLLIFAFLIIGGTLWYTHTIVSELEDRQKQVADLYAKSLEYLANAPETMGGDYGFVFDEIIRAIDFPIILTDAHNEPITPLVNAYKNLEIDTSASAKEQRARLKTLLAQMDSRNKPITVAYQDSIVLNYVHFDESPLVTRLRWLPYVEISIIGLFILIGYISFSYVKRSEQGNIWIGMARETAHQLGTPISSMMGWVELLKSSSLDPSLTTTIRDMENDVQRLQKIADRFSKIGSKPDLKPENLTEIISRTIQYFERRIPQSGKKVQIRFEHPGAVNASVNSELFEWVLENLIKNALDAIENGTGTILISLSESDRIVTIDVADTGKGIEGLYKKDIFRPGFSTKTRGWGLGLSLSQRIVETYHKGRLFLKESHAGSGTTFRVRLKK
ncbi:MAG: HAMP domain-containing histidine kinase [Ignavibacteriales bacterium]|nr:HAMP domain-containing histidine kinase [Ignavibacteriales bacterium]